MERTDPLHGIVRQVVRALRKQGERLCIAPHNAAEFWNVCTRPTSARGGLGLSLSEADRRLRIVERLFQVLAEPSAAYMIWRNLIVAHGVIGVQVHDARLVAFMTTNGLARILSLNANDFLRYPGITAMTPADVLAASP